MAYTTDAKTIIDLAASALDDLLSVNWSAEELLSWLNLAQLEMVNLSPRTNIKTGGVKLVAGVKQTLPADGLLLLDIPFNRGATNTTLGNTINAVSRTVMNRRIPNWTLAAASTSVQRYIYNTDAPKEFYIYPPQTSVPGYVEMEYAAIPVTIPNANAGTKITVDDEYRNILLNMVLSKALSKYSDVGDNAAKAREYRALAELELGIGRADKPADQSQNKQSKNNTEG
jgi:hypothetical protein